MLSVGMNRVTPMLRDQAHDESGAGVKLPDKPENTAILV
jgi:hypothetical protein